MAEPHKKCLYSLARMHYHYCVHYYRHVSFLKIKAKINQKFFSHKKSYCHAHSLAMRKTMKPIAPHITQQQGKNKRLVALLTARQHNRHKSHVTPLIAQQRDRHKRFTTLLITRQHGKHNWPIVLPMAQ